MLGLGNTLSGGIVPAAAGIADAPVTDGLIGYWRGGEGITTDTSGGTTTVSQWDNIASDRGGVADQTWHMTQGTKADQPTYDASGEVVSWDGGVSNHQSLVFDQSIINFDTTWSIVFLTDISNTATLGLFLGGAVYTHYLRNSNTQANPFYRFHGNCLWYPPWDDSDSNMDNANFNLIGWTWAASPTSMTDPGTGYISNQYLFEAGSDNRPGYGTVFTSPSDVPLYVLGAYAGQSGGVMQQDIKEVMIFNKQLNQTETTAIYDYADSIVTLNVLPDGLDYYGSE